MWLRIEADQHAERAIARQLGRFGCRVVEESPTTIRAELPEATPEPAALVEMRLYLGMGFRSVRALLAAAGIASGEEAERGLDHGVFVPFLLIYTQAEIHVVKLSLRQDLAPAAHPATGPGPLVPSDTPPPPRPQRPR